MNYGMMFSSAGFGELMLEKIGFKCKVANEVVKSRMEVHKFLYSNSESIHGNIMNNKVYEQFKNKFKKNKCDFLFATPPCQGFSLIGKNKNNEQMLKDQRNFLIFRVIQFIKEVKPNYVLIENVPRFLKMNYIYNSKFINIEEVLIQELGKEYNIQVEMYNATQFKIAQNRTRVFIKIYKKNLAWRKPILSKKILTLKDAIGHLPSIESGEKTNLKWHNGRTHSKDHILWMRHTPTGKTALDNKVHYPKNKNGDKLRAYKASYRRLEWNKPCPTITMRNDAISSQSNVHPGKKNNDGSYSDARVLSLREIFILSSIPEELELPKGLSEIQIRHLVGECVPPLMVKKIVEGILND